MPFIKFSNLNFTPYDSDKKVLKDISFDIIKGKITTIIGPNGAGKSTLIELLLGLKKPTSGIISIPQNLSIAYVPQSLTISEYLPLRVRDFANLGLSPQEIYETHNVFAQFGVCHTLDQSIHSLSGGEMQRVLVARAILKRSHLLVLDEPAQGLDINSINNFYSELGDIQKKLGITVLMVSHDLNWVMASSDHVICLNGHICCEGNPEVISEHQEYIKLFGKNAAFKNIAPYIHHHDHIHGEDCHHD
jgi:zinc transport system ATP-binding protein